jgi:hypothetical protein
MVVRAVSIVRLWCEGPRRADKKGTRVLFLSSHYCSPIFSASPGMDDSAAVIQVQQRAYAQVRCVSQSATRYVTGNQGGRIILEIRRRLTAVQTVNLPTRIVNRSIRRHSPSWNGPKKTGMSHSSTSQIVETDPDGCPNMSVNCLLYIAGLDERSSRKKLINAFTRAVR